MNANYIFSSACLLTLNLRALIRFDLDEAMLGVRGHAPPFFFKEWCNLVHSRVHFSLQTLLILRLIFFFLMLPFQTSRKKQEKKSSAILVC